MSCIVFLTPDHTKTVNLVAGRAQGQLEVAGDGRGHEVVRRVPAGAVLPRIDAARPKSSNAKAVADLDGALVDVAIAELRAAWEVTHAR